VSVFSAAQRRYLFVQNTVGAAVINLLINGAIGWVITRGLDVFPMWSIPGAAADLAATGFGVSFGTCIAARIGVSWEVTRGKIVPPPQFEPYAGWYRRLPRPIFARSVWFGLWSLPVFVLPLLLALVIAGSTAFERVHFIWLKAGFSALEAAIVTPLIVLSVLFDLAAERAAPA
jgi:hypothetical protein